MVYFKEAEGQNSGQNQMYILPGEYDIETATAENERNPSRKFWLQWHLERTFLLGRRCLLRRILVSLKERKPKNKLLLFHHKIFSSCSQIPTRFLLYVVLVLSLNLHCRAYRSKLWLYFSSEEYIYVGWAKCVSSVHIIWKTNYFIDQYGYQRVWITQQ